ncbi:hypothetical protein M758_6G197500 [Ceratodon purpureus]|nr:hypothetical protein M758_6G197500 [Ceratodon purpureus]
MAATTLQRHSLHSPCIQISSSVSSRSATVQNVNLRLQHVNSSSSLGWVCSRMRCGMERVHVGSWRSWTPRRVRVGSRGGDSDVEEEEDEEDGLALYEEELGLEDQEQEKEEKNVPSNGVKVRRTFRLLGSKEKKELRAYAHQLGSDICLHQVGKWGLTANCITAISDALEANELVKIRVLDNLDEELADTASQLEGKTGAQIVGRIGRTFLLYRPSMRKLKAAQEAEERAYKFQKRKNMLASRSVIYFRYSLQGFEYDTKDLS